MTSSFMKLDDQPCEELLYAYAQGDISAFEALYDRHKTSIKTFVYNRTHDMPAADDISQLVWERIIKSATDLRKQHSASPGSFVFKPYIYTIAQNLITDRWRAEGKVQHSSLSAFSDESTTDVEDSDSLKPEGHLSLQQLGSCVENKLAKFKQGFVDAFCLTRDGHLGYGEAAVALGVNIETLRSRVKAVLMSVKPCLESYKNA